ncbi:unnamed protein product [Effrenium voratum]|uniref:Programmed cell death protein 2 C-terminal domain-containing protein n=1 Tax=Effrenium voratum TaxID=2562239 RepID=A0AA36JIY1_9DINO|nr:unnamed protein product [Effrenium voratum]
MKKAMTRQIHRLIHRRMCQEDQSDRRLTWSSFGMRQCSMQKFSDFWERIKTATLAFGPTWNFFVLVDANATGNATVEIKQSDRQGPLGARGAEGSLRARVLPDEAPIYREKRGPATPLEVLSEKAAADAAKARSATAAAESVSQDIEALSAAGRARAAARGAEKAAQAAKKDLAVTKEATTDLLRAAEEAEALAKEAAHSIGIGEEAAADIPAQADALIGRRLDLKLAKPLREFMEHKAKQELANQRGLAACYAFRFQEVLLGFLGRKLDEEPALDVRTSRFGGAAHWSMEPSAESAVRLDFLRCGKCGEELALFVQLGAGYGDLPKRLLHIFGCRNSSCGSDSRAWRALRSTGPATPLEETTEVLPKEGGYAAWDAPKEDDWGADDWTTGAADADAEIEALLAARSQPAPKARVEKRVPPSEEDPKAWHGIPAPSRCRWPCLCLNLHWEPEAFEKSFEHEEELLRRYMQNELGTEDAGPLPKELEVEAANLREEAKHDVPSEAEAGFGDEDNDDEDAEEALRAGQRVGIDWWRRFQRRVARSPEQVLRYHWGGEPLWLQAPSGTAVPHCSCGSRRGFELQLMPMLHAQLAAAAPAEKSSALSMEWGTVVVFTCAKDCPAADPKEEFVVVQPAE